MNSVPDNEADGGKGEAVKVTAQGVQFGNAWYSHEKITGYSAEQLNSGDCRVTGRAYMTWVQSMLAAPQAECVPCADLASNEQYQSQMAAICTASLGYWKEGDSIHPDYDTPALHDVAKLYAKYEALRAEPQ